MPFFSFGGVVTDAVPRLLIILGCTVLTEVGELEKLGNPVSVVDEGAATTTTNAPAVQQPAANMYQQGQQPQQVQQSRPSQ